MKFQNPNLKSFSGCMGGQDKSINFSKLGATVSQPSLLTVVLMHHL